MREKKTRSTNVLFRRRSRTEAQRRELVSPPDDAHRPKWPLALLMAGVAVSFAWSVFLAWCCLAFIRWLIG